MSHMKFYFDQIYTVYIQTAKLLYTEDWETFEREKNEFCINVSKVDDEASLKFHDPEDPFFCTKSYSNAVKRTDKDRYLYMVEN